MVTILKTTTAFECPIFRVEERRVAFEDGAEETRYVIVWPPSVSVIALTDDGQIVLITERVGKLHEGRLAIPGGKMRSYIPTLEELRAEARVELRTEAGYEATRWELLATQELPSDYVDRTYYRFVAWGLTNVGQKLERGEDITVMLTSPSEVVRLLATNAFVYREEAQAIERALAFFRAQGLIE